MAVTRNFMAVTRNFMAVTRRLCGLVVLSSGLGQG